MPYGYEGQATFAPEWSPSSSTSSQHRLCLPLICNSHMRLLVMPSCSHALLTHTFYSCLCCLQLADLARAEQYMSRLSRVAAAISLRTSDPLTEGAHDPITQLRHYYATVAGGNVTMSWEVRLAVAVLKTRHSTSACSSTPGNTQAPNGLNTQCLHG